MSKCCQALSPWLAMLQQRVLLDLIGDAALLKAQQKRADALLMARLPAMVQSLAEQAVEAGRVENYSCGCTKNKSIVKISKL
ncbi:hypothetical protein [Mesorhizobium sp. M0184]|uniref:hypothetical protein n=1 Tax=unclassified Mesorhizobium TaxID=325217 RepID=UPI00333803EC